MFWRKKKKVKNTTNKTNTTKSSVSKSSTPKTATKNSAPKSSSKKNIRSIIKFAINDQRSTANTRDQAKRLNRYIGTDKKIPDTLIKDIIKNSSTSDIVKQMKAYVKGKK